MSQAVRIEDQPVTVSVALSPSMIEALELWIDGHRDQTPPEEISRSEAIQRLLLVALRR